MEKSPGYAIPAGLVRPYYQPDIGVCADFIPFWHQDSYYLYFIHNWQDEAQYGEGTPWNLLRTRDFVHFEDYGEVISRGDADSQDLFIFTGSIMTSGNQHHCYYTGHNEHLRQQGQPMQAIMHATSPDLISWQKDDQVKIFAPDDLDPHDWRDPFVYLDPDDGLAHMLVAARRKTGPDRRRGCIAHLVSQDLVSWLHQPVFWDPGLCVIPECIDLFQMGDWWYLLYSHWTELSRVGTHIRRSRFKNGPWESPADDVLDSSVFYAAKTASDGRKRYLFGWSSRYLDDRQHGSFGGRLIVHELWQDEQGQLNVRIPETLEHHFMARTVARLPVAALSAPYGYESRAICQMPRSCLITVRVTMRPGTRGAGLMLRADDDLDQAYYVRLEPLRQRLVFDYHYHLNRFFERPAALQPGQAHLLKIVLHDNVCVVYLDDSIALTAHTASFPDGQLACFVLDGEAVFSDLAITTHD